MEATTRRSADAPKVVIVGSPPYWEREPILLVLFLAAFTIMVYLWDHPPGALLALVAAYAIALAILVQRAWHLRTGPWVRAVTLFSDKVDFDVRSRTLAIPWAMIGVRGRKPRMGLHTIYLEVNPGRLEAGGGRALHSIIPVTYEQARGIFSHPSFASEELPPGLAQALRSRSAGVN